MKSASLFCKMFFPGVPYFCGWIILPQNIDRLYRCLFLQRYNLFIGYFILGGNMAKLEKNITAVAGKSLKRLNSIVKEGGKEKKGD